MKFARAAVVQISEKSLTAILDGITQLGVKVQPKGRGRYRVFKSFKTVNRFKPLNPAGSNRSSRSIGGF
jgi:hypothetical protein